MTTIRANAYLQRLSELNDNIDSGLSSLKSAYTADGGFSKISESGFNCTNLIYDLINTSKLALPLVSSVVGNVSGYSLIDSVPLQSSFIMDGIDYRNSSNPNTLVAGGSGTNVTAATDVPSGTLYNRWVSRTIFKFTPEAYTYDRLQYRIPVLTLAQNIALSGNNIASKITTNYPYPEEIIMTSADNEKNFIHFINIQYTDGHVGYYNKRPYNLMIVKDRNRLGVLNNTKDAPAKYTSVYANNLSNELAYYDTENHKLVLPVPDREFGDDLLNTLWDCRIIWRNDTPTRNISIGVEDEYLSSAMTENNISDTDRSWCSVCYGNGKFIAIADTDDIFAYSTNGITWTEGIIGDSDSNWYSVCYGNDKFVAISWRSSIFAYSTDGVTWTEATISDTNRNWYRVCYGNNKFVAITSFSNTFAYSTDGITWTEGTISTTYRIWKSVCYGDGKFVAVADDSNIFAYSTDGIIWTEGAISDNTRDWESVYYGNGNYIVITYGSNIFAYSTDGITWTESTISDTDRNWISICYGDGKFVAVADDSNIFAYSTDGITWIEDTISDTDRYWFSICYGNGKYVAVTYNSNKSAILGGLKLSYTSETINLSVISGKVAISDTLTTGRMYEISNKRSDMLSLTSNVINTYDAFYMSGAGLFAGNEMIPSPNYTKSEFSIPFGSITPTYTPNENVIPITNPNVFKHSNGYIIFANIPYNAGYSFGFMLCDNTFTPLTSGYTKTSGLEPFQLLSTNTYPALKIVRDFSEDMTFEVYTTNGKCQVVFTNNSGSYTASTSALIRYTDNVIARKVYQISNSLVYIITSNSILSDTDIYTGSSFTAISSLASNSPYFLNRESHSYLLPTSDDNLTVIKLDTNTSLDQTVSINGSVIDFCMNYVLMTQPEGIKTITKTQDMYTLSGELIDFS